MFVENGWLVNLICKVEAIFIGLTSCGSIRFDLSWRHVEGKHASSGHEVKARNG